MSKEIKHRSSLRKYYLHALPLKWPFMYFMLKSTFWIKLRTLLYIYIYMFELYETMTKWKLRSDPITISRSASVEEVINTHLRLWISCLFSMSNPFLHLKIIVIIPVFIFSVLPTTTPHLFFFSSIYSLLAVLQLNNTLRISLDYACPSVFVSHVNTKDLNVAGSAFTSAVNSFAVAFFPAFSHNCQALGTSFWSINEYFLLTNSALRIAKYKLQYIHQMQLWRKFRFYSASLFPFFKLL